MAFHGAVPIGHLAADAGLGPEMLFPRVEAFLEGVVELAEPDRLGVLFDLATFVEEPLQRRLVQLLRPYLAGGGHHRQSQSSGEWWELQVHQGVHEVRRFLFQFRQQLLLGDFLLRQEIADFNHRDARIAGNHGTGGL